MHNKKWRIPAVDAPGTLEFLLFQLHPETRSICGELYPTRTTFGIEPRTTLVDRRTYDGESKAERILPPSCERHKLIFPPSVLSIPLITAHRQVMGKASSETQSQPNVGYMMMLDTVLL